MTTLELLTMPGMGKSKKIRRMREESENKLRANELSQRLAMAAMYGRKTPRKSNRG